MIFPPQYQSLTIVRFQGTVIALACAPEQVIHYRVLEADGDPKSEDSWSPSAALEFPVEVRAAGASVLTLTTTEAYGQPSPMQGTNFSAVADDTHVYIFRT